MKLSALLILIGGALPAAALAQSPSAPAAQPSESTALATQNAPTTSKPGARLQSPQARKKQGAALRTWSLDKAGKKPQGQQQARAAGPAMPPEPVVKVPRQRTAKSTPQKEKKPRVNAAPLVNTILRKGGN